MRKETNKAQSSFGEKWRKLKEIIKRKRPLIHHITNNVTVNDCANITLNWGALPVMAPGLKESDQMVASASALVLNLGTISVSQLNSMLKAGKKANQLGIPVILDPVGVGATKFRASAGQKLLAEIKFSIIKGNKGEISFLAGKEVKMKGVESIGKYKGVEKSAQLLAAEFNTLVVVSGKSDLIAGENEIRKNDGGDQMLAELVGTGCMLASTLAVFAAAAQSSELSLLESTETALYYYSQAAEKAAAKVKTPAKFKLEFMDQIYLFQHCS